MSALVVGFPDTFIFVGVTDTCADRSISEDIPGCDVDVIVVM